MSSEKFLDQCLTEQSLNRQYDFEKLTCDNLQEPIKCIDLITSWMADTLPGDIYGNVSQSVFFGTQCRKVFQRHIYSCKNTHIFLYQTSLGNMVPNTIRQVFCCCFFFCKAFQSVCQGNPLCNIQKGLALTAFPNLFDHRMFSLWSPYWGNL